MRSRRHFLTAAGGHCAWRQRPRQRSSASRSLAWAARRCRSRWPPSATRPRRRSRWPAIIRADLQRSGVFQPSEAPLPLDERSAVVLPEWRDRGADALVAGSVTRLADGRFDVRFKLWDVVKGEQLLGQSKVVLEADLRLAAHRIADEVHEKLTGERGVYATRIAYVVKSGRRYTLHITDADGEGGQVALASPEPIISPAWSPDGKELAYVSFESQKAVVWVQNLHDRRAPADRQLPRLQQRAGLVARRQHSWS